MQTLAIIVILLAAATIIFVAFIPVIQEYNEKKELEQQGKK